MKITKDMKIGQVISINPRAKVILEEFGLGCAHCELGSVETLEEGAKGHGLTEKEIQELVNQLNSDKI